MPTRRTRVRSPKFGLVRGARGWYKHVPGVGTKYVCSTSAAPDGAAADEVYRNRFPELSEVRSVPLNRLTVEDVMDAWLADPGMAKLSPHTTSFYRTVAKAFAAAVGAKTSAANLSQDHALAYRHSIAHVAATTRKNRLVYAKQAMTWAASRGLVRDKFWGDAFTVPTPREHRDQNALRTATKGTLDYSPLEIRKLLAKADRITSAYPLKLWTLLGINAALGQSDIDAMTRHHVRDGFLNFPRPKTGIKRTIPLWPETRAILDAWVAVLPKGRDKLFLSVTGVALHGKATNNIVTKEFKHLCDAVPVKSRGHYSLRRTFRTMVDPLPDRHAIDIIMGHEAADIGRRYVQSVDHARLVAITDHVRNLVRPHELDALD